MAVIPLVSRADCPTALHTGSDQCGTSENCLFMCQRGMPSNMLGLTIGSMLSFVMKFRAAPARLCRDLSKLSVLISTRSSSSGISRNSLSPSGALIATVDAFRTLDLLNLKFTGAGIPQSLASCCAILGQTARNESGLKVREDEYMSSNEGSGSNAENPKF